MHENHLGLLRCPDTGSDLTLEIRERYPDGLVKTGVLRTVDGSRRYDVREGIPRFCESGGYADSFAFEWALFGKTQLERTNLRRRMQEATREAFVQQTGFTREKLLGKTVVEFGCGPGRFLDIAREMGAVVVGLDITSAIDVARENLGSSKDVFLVQGSVLKPPFKRDTFDFGFTIGVLHHTPSPAEGAMALIDVVRPSGEVAISVYPEGGFYSFPSVYWMRKFINTVDQFLGNRCARTVALAYALLSAAIFYPVFWVIERIPLIGRLLAGIWAYFFAVIVVAPDLRWRVLDTFDAITPRYASTHTPDEVQFWLRAFGCEAIKSTGVKFGYSGAKPANFIGVKRPGTEPQ